MNLPQPPLLQTPPFVTPSDLLNVNTFVLFVKENDVRDRVESCPSSQPPKKDPFPARPILPQIVLLTFKVKRIKETPALTNFHP